MPGQIPEATMRSPFALTLALVATSGLAAQEGHEQHVEHVGRVRFPVSCHTEAQRSFERGVALLHSFWYEKAGDAFKDAVAADSTCAMAYWGQANATAPTFAYKKRADSILEPLFRAEPEHPGLAHYLIHTNDVPQLARLGLYAARRYAEIAPDVPHAQHMPSHIFTRLGLWDEDIASNTRSVAAAHKFEDERHLNALWDQRGHAWDYMAYAYLQQGRDAEAKRVVDEAAAVTAVYPLGSLTNAYALAPLPARYPPEPGRCPDATP